ncbi:MAG: GNAT family N-acetyltransferase [Bacteroidales bacterium]|nr:GNAT family N-acetyltransferase [Bacteroidales bacterium]
MKIIDLEDCKHLPKNNCSNLFNSFEWLHVISKTYGLKFKAVSNENQGILLPFALIEDQDYKSIISIPFGDYILNDCSQDTQKEVLRFLITTFPEYYIKVAIASKEQPVYEDFAVSQRGLLNQINIKKWKESTNWKEAYERNIRNALNYGLAVHISHDSQSILDFYLLHEQLRIHKFNKLPQPIQFFNHIHEIFLTNRKGFLIEAWSKDRIIASWLILIQGKTLYYKFGASNPEDLKLRPNDLLFRSLMQYGSDNGYSTIDLGFSGSGKSYEGLIRFKSKEGGDKIPIYKVEHFPPGFDETRQNEKTNYLNLIAEQAIGSHDLNVIRQASDHYYHLFS